MVTFVFFPGKIIRKETKRELLCLHVPRSCIYEYMKSLKNEVNNLFDNTDVQIKIYQEFYHCIIYRYIHNFFSPQVL